MASILRRPDSPFLWFKWRTASGQLRRAATQFRKDDPAQLQEAERALAMIAQQEENIRRPGEAAPLPARRRAERWVEQRKREGLTSARDDEARLRLHVLPKLGERLLGDVRPVEIRALFKVLQERGE